MTASVDATSPVPFDPGAITSTVPPLELELMTAIAEDAGRAAASGSDASPFDASPAMRVVSRTPGGGRMVAAARLYRAAYQGALEPDLD